MYKRHYAKVHGRFLEEELARRYRDAAPATLALLQERSNSLAAELAQSETKLHDMQDTASLRRLGTLRTYL